MRYRELLRNVEMYISRKANLGLAKPDRVSVNLTLRCNLSCVMCTTCYDSPEISLEEVKSIIDQTANWGVEVFNPLGGEPFMRSDIEEILSYAVRRGFYVTITTNGTLITSKRAARVSMIANDRLHFNFSLDGNASSNDKVRGEGMWKRAIEGYNRLRQADDIIGNARRKILANTILHAGNIDHFEQVLDEQEQLGFDGVQILNLFRSGPDKPTVANWMWFQPSHHEQLVDLCERLAQRVEQQEPVGYQIQNTPAELRNIPAYYQQDLQPLEAPCWAGWKELYINADGKAIMCDGKLDFLNGEFGNIRTQSLRQMWRSPQLKSRREVVKQCKTPCIQKCYLRPQSDSGRRLIGQGAGIIASKGFERLKKLRPGWRTLPNVTLRLELSDIDHVNAPHTQPSFSRWKEFIRNCKALPNRETFTTYRDDGSLNFGRGFMGFELVREIINDIEGAKLRFGVLALRWRGDPMLHPEIEPILRYLLQRKFFSVIQIETTGSFLRESTAKLALSSKPQQWVFDIDNGDETGIGYVHQYRGDNVQIVLQTKNVATSVTSYANFSPCTGGLPEMSRGDSLWFSAAEPNLPNVPHVPTKETIDIVISWDGKLTKTAKDHRLHHVVADVTEQKLSKIWKKIPSDG